MSKQNLNNTIDLLSMKQRDTNRLRHREEKGGGAAAEGFGYGLYRAALFAFKVEEMERT